MRTPSGILHVVDFKTSQIISNIQPKDYWDDKRHWEIKNNIDTLEFKVFDNTEDAATLMQQNIVLKEVRDGRIVPYVITETEKNSDDRSVTAYASGEWIQLAKSGIINPQKIVGKTVNEFIDMALVGTKWKRGKTEYAGFHTMTIDEFIDPLKFLKDIASLFELEIQYRAEVVGSQIVGRYVDMVKKRGRDTGKEVTLGKDLMGIKRIENSQNICTALLGFVKKEGGDFITISSINNGVPYLVDSDAFQRWNERGQHKFGFYTPETEQDITPQRLMTLMKTEIKKRVNSSVSYEVNAQSIGRVFGLAHELINEGDTIRIKDTGFTPKLYLEARAIAGDESFTDPSQDKYVFGDYREIVDANEELRKLYNKILVSLGDKANKELLEQLEILAEEAKKESEQAVKESQVAKEISEQLKENIENNMIDIIEAMNPPSTGLKPNKTLWRDISNGKPGILKIWTGTVWESVVPDTGPLQQSIKDAKKDIDTLKETVKDMPDTTWLNQQLEGKANKEDTYTKEWVNGNLIGKQVYETNREGDIKVLTETKTTAERTAEEIKNKAEKTEITTLTDNLKLVSQTANTAKQTAEENTNTITNLRTTVNNINDDVRNLLVASKTFDGSQWYLKGAGAKISKDTFNGNVVVETPTAWQSIAYYFSNLVQRGVVKEGDKVNYSIWTRLKGAAAGVSRSQSLYFESGATGGLIAVTNEWKRVDKTFIVTSIMMASTNPIRVEADAVGAGEIYQLSSPQLTIGGKIYSWRLAPEDIGDVGTFTKTTNEIKQTLDTNSQTISKVQQEQGTMQTTLNEVKQTTNSNSLDIKTLTETQTDQGKLIQENKNEITQTQDSLSSKISEKQMKAYVGALGSTNQFFNTEFKKKTVDANGNVTNEIASTDKWTIAGVVSGATVTPVTDRRHDGYNSVRIANAGVVANSWTGISQSIGVLQNSGDYVLSAWVYVVDKNLLDQGACVKLQFFNGSTAVGNFTQTEFKDSLVNGSWILVSATIKAPDIPITRLQGEIWVRRNGTMWISQPQLQQGKEPSVYMPNPKDITNYKELVDLVADKIAKKDFDTVTEKLQSSINQNTQEIKLRVEAEKVYTKEQANDQFAGKSYVENLESQISQTAESIKSTVKKGDIISSINQTAEQITIDVSKLAINADTMVKWLTAKGIDTNLIRISGDKITIDGEEGVIVNMLDFLFKDEWGTKTTAVSRRNLIADPDFSSVTKKNIGNADYYGFEGGYGLTWKSWGNVVIEKNTHVFDYEQMVNAARVDMYNYPEAIVNNGIHPGNEYTVSAHFRAAMVNGVRKTAKPRLQVCVVKFRDNVSYDILSEQKMDFPEPSVFYGEIRRYSFTFKVPTNYIPQEHALIIKVCSANGQITGAQTAVCVSGVTLYSGKYASMYNWDRAAAERTSGLQPFNRIAIGGVNNNIGPADDGQTFDISTEKDVKFLNYIRATQGINLGGNANQQWGHIRFTDGNRGIGFYVNNSNGWHFNALG
ncbi:phage tail spike protein [Bacillus cereus]|uniref:phage tail spike protein n=1 Tax=Bacillus cereus TaxID=1396 RepID=UPI000B7E2588|nr:phage tail spike protein [Bacillus cereus]